ncbi:MAG: LytR C-terminal domain-containing protein [Acidimicrobiales bacterium]
MTDIDPPDAETPGDELGGGGFFGPLERSGVIRGWVIVIGALVIGALLLPSATRGPLTVSSVATASSLNTPPTATIPVVHSHSADSTTTTTIASAASSTVTVLVANGTQTNGAAKAISTLLAGKGFHVLAPVDALTTVSASQVYAIGSNSADARLVASALNLSLSDIEPATQPVPVASVGSAMVVLIVGPDLATLAGS